MEVLLELGFGVKPRNFYIIDEIQFHGFGERFCKQLKGKEAMQSYNGRNHLIYAELEMAAAGENFENLQFLSNLEHLFSNLANTEGRVLPAPGNVGPVSVSV